MDCEVLLADDLNFRGRRILEAMISAAPKSRVQCIVTKSFSRKAKLVMSYGLGHPERREHTRKHTRQGGRLIGWDLGYWDRNRAMRLTIDGEHPKSMPAKPGNRWDAAGIALREDADPNGPILLIGVGPKSRDSLGLVDWEAGKLAEIRAAYPSKQVVYRPKKSNETLPGCLWSPGTIQEALKGVSLVVCRHSNVAVDACIAGVPVVCEAGAAALLYGNDLANPLAPTVAQRLDFLHRLAWFQWLPEEAGQAWQFILNEAL